MGFLSRKKKKNEKDQNSHQSHEIKVSEDPEGRGLVKKTDGIDNLLMERRGLTNSPPMGKQVQDTKKKDFDDMELEEKRSWKLSRK